MKLWTKIVVGVALAGAAFAAYAAAGCCACC